MTIRQLMLAFCILAVAPGAARADEATDAMRNARALYGKGDLGGAYARIEDAAAAIARIYSVRYARTFPRAPQGWRAGAVESTAATKKHLGRGMQLSRTYRQTGGPGIVKATLIVDSSGLVATLIENLKKRGAGVHNGATPVSIRGAGTAYLVTMQKGRYATLSILVDRRYYIKVSTNRMDPSQATRPQDVVKTVLEGWNFAALRKAGGLR